ncbi:MAG: FAD-binding oxidoreductase [Geodermatophilaceae bacterium]
MSVPVVQQRYDDAVKDLRRSYTALPATEPVRLAKRTSNLFRPRLPAPGGLLDVSSFAGVLDVDPVARTADVLGMTTYEQLVDATLAHDLMPLVVPQLKTITLGGAVSGLGIESASFRNGTPHESVLDVDVLTGDGQVVTARADNEHRDLFYGFPNSYGTLGYALRLRIELEPVRRYVQLRHLHHREPAAYFAAVAEICRTGRHDGQRVDFVDGTVFAPDELYCTIGTFVANAPYTSDYTGMNIYYQSVQHRREDFLTVRDYLWRWDTDWFWCSRAFGVQTPWVRRIVPKRYLRSDTYWRLIALEQRYGVVRRLEAARGKPVEERVVQDIEVPVDRAAEFLDFLHRDTDIRPVWICPLRQRDPDAGWDLYQLDPGTLYINVGFWSTVPLRPGEAADTHNRRVEVEVTRLGGRKSLYSTSSYPEEEFWHLYNGPAYRKLKDRYDAGGRLLDLFSKTVRGR